MYREAIGSGRPTAAVQMRPGYSRRTAARRVEQAREANHLPKTTKGKVTGYMASISKRPNGQWRARYRDDAGREYARHFDRRVDAQRWLDETTASIVTGAYVAPPNAGRVTFREYAEKWRAMQVHRPTTQAHVEPMLRRHAYPTFGDRPLSAVLPSDVQAWVQRLGSADPTSGREALSAAPSRFCTASSPA